MASVDHLKSCTRELIDAVVEAMRIDGIDAEDKCNVEAEGDLCCGLCRAEGCMAEKVARAKAALR